MPELIFGHKWYRYLLPNTEHRNNSLFERVPKETAAKTLIVSQNVTQRLFTSFQDHVVFAKHQQKYKHECRCFFEVVLDEQQQKPRFDIEANFVEYPQSKDFDWNHVTDTIIDAIAKVFHERKEELCVEKDILLYSSHGNDKKSFHIVINNYYHQGSDEAKTFYHDTMQYIPTIYHRIVDPSVYSTTQQFRIVGSQKYQSGRVKTFHDHWLYHGVMIEHKYNEEPEDGDHLALIQLEESLLTRTANCKHLFRLENQEQPVAIQKKHSGNHQRQTDFDDIVVTKEDAQRALEMYADVVTGGKIRITDPKFPYRLAEIQGGLLRLRRRRASMCPVCKRMHDSENPFLFIVGEEKTVYFHCRRAATSQKLFIGKLCPGVGSQKIDKRVDEWLSQVLGISDQIPKDHLEELSRNPVGVAPLKKKPLRLDPTSNQRVITDEMLPGFSWW